MNILLYGPSGSGKSTVGKILGNRLAIPWFDLDAEIERSVGTSIETFFAAKGELAFRDIESAALDRILKENFSSVISLGGGALLNDQNRQKAEKSGRVIVLSGSIETLLTRLMADEYVRPLIKADPRQRLTDLLARREAHYSSFGESVQTDGFSPEEIASQLQIRLGRFKISGMDKSYDVIIEPGALEQLGNMLQQRQLHAPAALVCDSHVEPLYASRCLASLQSARIEVKMVTIPAGEEHKTIQTITSIWNGFLQAEVERGSVIIALGGGVTGDLTGFAAATYLRGIPWVNVPTTLLAMVDSSLGGKTGADLPQGKNLIGAFHAPSLVLSDPLTLATLPDAELRSGLAETLKHSVIADPVLYQQLKTGGWPQETNAITSLIRRAVAVKAAVIEADPYEKGLRQALNFGHTVGHGIETASNYRLSHGECVAIGMVIETRLAEKIGLAKQGLSDKIGYTLSKLGLPVCVPSEIDRSAIRNAMSLDKKRSCKHIHFALPEAIGKMRTGVVIENWQDLIEL